MNKGRIRLKCLDCGGLRFVDRLELNRAARVRCLRCGGLAVVSISGGGRLAEGQRAADAQARRMRDKMRGDIS